MPLTGLQSFAVIAVTSTLAGFEEQRHNPQQENEEDDRSGLAKRSRGHFLLPH